MPALVDTDVLVDCLRGTAPAAAWLGKNSAEALAVPGIACIELVLGCRNQDDLRKCKKLLDTFRIEWPDSSEMIRAHQLLLDLYLSTRLSIPDAIIAAMALSRGITLHTFNLRHFQVIPDLDVVEPYPRNND